MDTQHNNENKDADTETLTDALIDYYESCIRTEHYDMAECARYYVKECDHLDLDYSIVYSILKRLDKEHNELFN